MQYPSFYARAFESLLFPAWERFVKRRDTCDLLAFLRASQWMPREEIARYQLAALKRLLVHAQTNVPYYRETFRKAGFDARGMTKLEDVEAIPLLTRDIVRERYQDLVDPATIGKNLKKGTSGSTGAPLKFEYSRESECWRQATRIRGYEWAGYKPGAPTFYYWAVVTPVPGGARGAKVRLDRAMKRETYFDSMKQDEASRRRAVAMLRKTRPAVIVCYTQSCAQLARFISDNGLRDWDDIPVIAGAEAVLPADRAAIARAFGPRIHETYGSRETMLIAADCGAHDGMHLSEENLYVEVKRGEIVVTDLHNLAMPFIRYVNGDLGVMADDKPCACGRGLRKLARVDGRRADFLLAKDGRPIPGIVFHVLFSDARREVVRQFRAVQKASGEVVLSIVRGREWDPERFAQIVRRFDEYLGGLPFSVEVEEHIPPGANGKMKTIVVERA